MRLFFGIVTLFFSLTLFAQGDRFKKGHIIDTVWVDRKLEESFAFYMPKSYEPTKPASIIFIFDPLARGNTGIKPFIKTSETYGYLLVCSNDSKNGPFERNYAISDRLFKKVFASIKIDPERIYTSGFSGGGRLATSIAIRTDQIQGVVSCGSAFSINSGGLPTVQNFSYTTIMGEQDMNYYELVFTKKYLSNAKLGYEIFTHDFGHSWPSQDQILLAFDWLQLEAYKKLLITHDQTVIRHIYDKFYQQALIKEKDGRLTATANEYQRIIDNFQSYYLLDSIQEKLSSLKKSKIYKTQVKKNESLLDTEISLTRELLGRFYKEINQESYQIDWWKNQIEKLNKKKETDSRLEKNMYNRLISKTFAHAFEYANQDNPSKTIGQKIFCYDICILIYPSYSFPYIKQIENAIQIGETDLALDYLERLLNTGYDKKESLFTNESIKTLKNNDRFKKIISKITK